MSSMSTLEDLQPNAAVRGILPDSLVTVVSVQWFGSEALELTYKSPVGKVANELLYRHDEPRLEIVEHGRPWSFDGDGSLFRLVSEAQRIRLAHLFDPVLAVHTSVVEPLPHQVRPIDCARLSFHGGSCWRALRPGLVTGRIARPVRSRRVQISTATGTSPLAFTPAVDVIALLEEIAGPDCCARRTT